LVVVNRTKYPLLSSKLGSDVNSLSELLNLPLPSLPPASQKSDSILLSTSNHLNGELEEIITLGGKWEDEEERRFFEEIQDLKDFVPSSVLGVESAEADEAEIKETERDRAEKAKEEAKKLEEELQKLNGGQMIEPKNNEDYDEE